MNLSGVEVVFADSCGLGGGRRGGEAEVPVEGDVTDAAMRCFRIAAPAAVSSPCPAEPALLPEEL
jgi:hypothetical protein